MSKPPRRVYRASTKRRPRLPMGFYVCAEQCGQCLFSRNRIVSGPAAAQIIRECLEADRFFVCHIHSLRERASTVTPSDTQVCCRAYFDRMGDRVWPLRYARATGGIVFVDAQGQAVAGQGWGPPVPPARRQR